MEHVDHILIVDDDREIRELVNKDIEVLRADGKLGASLQAEVTLTVAEDDYAMLASLGALGERS